VAVMMGTPHNKALLQQAGLLTAAGEAGGANDLLICVQAETPTVAAEALRQATARMAPQQGQGVAARAAAAWRDGASAAEQMGDRKTARKLYERIRRGSPFDRTATERLASLVETSGDWSSLPELYAALVESAGTGGERKDALLKLADVLKTRMNDATGAFDAAARAFLETPEDPTVLERLVDLGLAANAAQTRYRSATKRASPTRRTTERM